jgi:hypothetical protein
MAACLVVGVGVGRMTLSAPLVGDDMRARGALASALDEGLASAPEGRVRLGLTFASAGGYCRTFQSRDSAGLACREGGAWTVEALAPFEGGGEFRTASAMPPAVAAALDARMTGEALDALAERAARDRGWR